MSADDLTLLRYAETCTRVAAAYIERATRFKVTDLRILEARPVMRQFHISVTHQLEVTSDACDYHGVQHAGPDDFSSADWQWYQEQVTSQAQSEFKRPATLDDLVSAVESQAYAAISTQTCIRTHPRRLFHTFKCSACHGKGEIACHGCSGSGKVKCAGCYGSGCVSCGTCNGSGSVVQTRQVRDYNGYSRTETQHRSCGSCSGGEVSCFSCGGSGRRRCGTCSGSGVLTCTGCSGHGYLTRITTTQTYTLPSFGGRYPEGTPDYVHAALSKAGFARLAEHGRISLQDVDVMRERSAAEFNYQCSMPFCELAVEVRGVHSHWVLFGTTPQIFDADEVLEALLQDDFDQLAEVSGGAARWLPWFYRHARKALAPFMESELNQEIVEASAQGLAPRAIVERVNRSVSEAYVGEALWYLMKTLQVAASWSRVKWLMAFALLSVPFALAVFAYLGRDQARELVAPNSQLFIHVPNTSGFLWEMGVLTVPLTALGWFMARWLSRRWVKQAGGARTLVWAEQQGLLMGKWTAAAIVVAAAATSGAFFNRWPLWIDASGQAYGWLPLFQPPRTIEPAPPVTKAVQPKRPVKKKRAPPRRVAPVTAEMPRVQPMPIE